MSEPTREELLALLVPFAREGRRWLGTAPHDDDLTLLLGEEWGLMNSHSRETAITVGDMKRAGALWDRLYDFHHAENYPRLCSDG